VWVGLFLGAHGPQVRADLLGNLLVLDQQGLQLCYDPALRLQLLVSSGGGQCDGDGSGTKLMLHYPHAPLQGGPGPR
jgi:hypothetical protein